MKLFLLVLAIVTIAQTSNLAPFDWSSIDLVNLPRESHVGRERRIHNGQPVVPHSIPYQAGVLTRHAEPVVGRWGGSLITPRSVLASAHSFFTPLSEVVIVLGAHYITTLEPSQQRFYMDLDNIIRHPGFINGHDNFNMNRNPNDVAVLILPRDAILNQFVGLSILPTGAQTGELFLGELATVSGFGRPNPSEPWTDDLRSTTNRIITNEECQRQLPGWIIHASDMCAENTGNGSSCGGDCGSPVTIVRNGQRVQIGLVPMGPPCNQGLPDLFTRVNSFLPWILENAQ